MPAYVPPHLRGARGGGGGAAAPRRPNASVAAHTLTVGDRPGTALHDLIEGGCTAEDLRAEACGRSAGVLNDTNTGGWTALRLAATKRWDNSLELVKVLLSAGANPHTPSKGGMLATHAVAEVVDCQVSVDIMRALLQADASLLEATTDARNTPLHYAGAVSARANTAMWQFLVARGAKTDCANAAGHTPVAKKRDSRR